VRLVVACLAVAGAAAIARATLHAEEQFQFVVSVLDDKGAAVTDLKPDDVVMKEGAKRAKVLKLEPFSIPAKVTLVIDNSRDSQGALSEYRAGLSGFLEAIPADVEMTILTSAPQPRTVVKMTNDRTQLTKGLTMFAPEQTGPRFTDAVVEFAQRLDKEMKDAKSKERAPNYLPVLVMVSTTAQETVGYEVDTINKALNVLQARRAKLFVVMAAMRDKNVKSGEQINTSAAAMMSQSVAKTLGGRYEGLAVPNGLAAVLTEYGQQVAALHTRHAHQVRVTVARPDGISGPLQDPSVEIARPGLKGEVSLDGYLP